MMMTMCKRVLPLGMAVFLVLAACTAAFSPVWAIAEGAPAPTEVPMEVDTKQATTNSTATAATPPTPAPMSQPCMPPTAIMMAPVPTIKMVPDR